MQVVLYLRYSSDKQSEQSIEGQMRVCKKFCNDMGYTIVDTYIDRALSASKDPEKRIEFQRMIHDSDKRLWQGVVVYKLDRFARDRYDSAIYKSKLKKNGVRVISATENISDNPEGIILESVLEGMAEFYSKELAQKINRGMRESALKCQSCGGHVSLGYKTENKKLVIDPKTAPIVQEAFQLYADGWTISAICEYFNNKGYRTKKGEKFNKNSFRSIFGNEKYIGVYQYMDIKVENGVPSIIDKETFDKVQIRLNKQANAPARGKAIVDYMLSGKLFCGHCQSHMIGAASTSHTGKKYFYYCCANNRHHNGCSKQNVRKDFIERKIIETTSELLTDENIEKIADMAYNYSLNLLKNNAEITKIKNELEEIKKSIARLIELVESGVMSESVANRINELEKQKLFVENELRIATAQSFPLDKAQIACFLKEFTKGDLNDTTYQSRICDLLINSAIVYDNEDGSIKIKIAYNLCPNNTKTICVKDVENAEKCVFNSNGGTDGS